MKLTLLIAGGGGYGSSGGGGDFYVGAGYWGGIWIDYFSGDLIGCWVAESGRSGNDTQKRYRDRSPRHIVLSPNSLEFAAEGSWAGHFGTSIFADLVRSQVVIRGCEAKVAGESVPPASLPALFDRDAAPANETLGLRNAKTVLRSKLRAVEDVCPCRLSLRKEPAGTPAVR